MTGVVTIAPTSVVDGEGIQRADEGLTASEAMERGFEDNPELWGTPDGQRAMAKLREIAARQGQPPANIGPVIPDEQRQKAIDRINELKQDRAFGARWLKGDADAVAELDRLHQTAYGGKSNQQRASRGTTAFPPPPPQLNAAQRAAAAVLNDHKLAEKARNGDQSARDKIAAAVRTLP